MATGKTAMLTFRIEPLLKMALREAVDREHRSIASADLELLRTKWN
jgi:hypothetical protein